MINIKNLNKIYKNFYAIKDINIKINKSEFIVLKGSSGSGKSTLLSIIGAITKPTSGSVEVDGENIVSYSDHYASYYRKYRVGFVTQSFHLFGELSVRDNIFASLANSDFTTKEIDHKIKAVMNLANITHKQNQKASTLSGGEQQRVVIARAMVNNPDIILCDEPTANLDKKNSLLFIEILKKLKSMDKTIIVSTHDTIFDDLDFIDKVLFIEEGSIE